MRSRFKKKFNEIEDKTMSIGNLKKGQELSQEAVRKLTNLAKIFKEGIIDFVLFEAIIHEYFLPYSTNLPQKLINELTKNVFNPDLAEFQTIDRPPKTAFTSFAFKIKQLLGTHANATIENKLIIDEILDNGITEQEQKREISLFNDKANEYWETLLAQDKAYEEKINSINMDYYNNEVAKELKRSKDSARSNKNSSAYAREVSKPKLLKQNVRNLTYEDYLPIFSNLGIKESKKPSLKSYLEKNLTISPKEAFLIESVVREYVRRKRR